MNSNKRVLYFVTGSIMVYLLLSVIATVSGFEWKPFRKVNLLSDVFISKPYKIIPSKPVIVKAKPADSIKNIRKEIFRDFSLYTQANIITNFISDTTQSSLNNFLKKLHELKRGRKRKLRIAYFGDSMIEGDLLTQTFRKLLQREFGGSGVGFVPVTSQIAGFRSTVYENFSGGWQDQNFKTAENMHNMFLSGHIFYATDDWVEMRDQTKPDSAGILEKSLLCGFAAEPVSIKYFNTDFSFKARDKFNRIPLPKDQKRNIRISIANEQLPVYGISFEPISGISVDNFSFRGITGIELDKIDTALLKSIEVNNPYDLVIFQYGVNLLFRPNDTNFDWYGRVMINVIKKIKRYFTNADVIVMSTADRAFRYEGEYKSAIGIDSLVKVQAAEAFNSGVNFYNVFETMGGHNSIVKWAAAKPSMAISDYVHPNARGTDTLATWLFQALMNDYGKYVHNLK